MPPVTRSLGGGTQSVLLTVAILERLGAKDGPIGVSELAREIGTSKSRIHRHLQTLVSCEFVAADGASGEYSVGPRLAQLSRRIGDRYDLVAVARPVLEDLRDELGHTVIVSRVEGGGVQVLRSLTGRSDIVIAVRAGSILPFATSAQGKIAMAFTPDADVAPDSALAIARANFAAQCPAELEQIRRQGWSLAEMREGLIGLGAPVFGAGGALVATLGLLDTAHELVPAQREARGRALAQAGRALSMRLGSGLQE